MTYDTAEAVAKFLSGFQMEITHRGKGTFTPDHVKYSLTIANGGKDFSTTFESNPHVHGEPTITQVFGALASDAMVVRDYGMDEFVDEFCDGMKPSAAIRAYNSCKETYDWMRDGLYLSNGDIASLSEVISENEDEVNTLVEKAASERAARYAYDHPKLPKGFVTIEQLQGDLDLYDHCEDICRYGTLDQLRDMGVYAIRESLADEILNDLSYDKDYAPTDDAKDTIISAIYATFEEKYGEDFADCADNFIQDNDDIAGRVNPCAMSVETVRAVYGMGFDAVFLNDWKKELAECDIDPEAVSVDSEAHDMENGRDGLDGNAPEKDAPEKDDRDAQPPVDTDNR